MTNPHRSYDAIVVGARCAGAVTAMLLARQGARVLAVERSQPGSDILSTHALMRPAVFQLARWGLLERVARRATAVRSTTFHYGQRSFEIPLKPRNGVEALYAPRRTLLDALLQDAAVSAGAELLHGVRVEGLTRSLAGRVDGVLLRDARGLRAISADVVIGADGLRSTVASLVGARDYRRSQHATCSIYGYFEGLPVSGYHWHYEGAYGAGAIPTSDGLTCVFAGVSSREFASQVKSDVEGAFARVLASCAPELAQQVAAARRAGGLRVFAGARGFMREPVGLGWALVGDAGYFKDPLTAHGITDAFRDAELLTRALSAGSQSALASYRSRRDELSEDFFEITDRVASMRWTSEELMLLHKRMSDEMKREYQAIERLDRAEQGLSNAQQL